MKKPEGVPQEAVWDPEDEEWCTGKRRANGDGIGEWKWWDAEEGFLICHAFFDDSSKLISAKRFHPNGELAEDIFYDEDGNHISIHFMSTDYTEEDFPESCFKNAWKAERIAGVSPKAYRFYDKQGNLLSLENDSKLEELKVGPENETAEQAVKRLDKVIDLIQKSENVDEDFLEELDDFHRPFKLEDVNEEQLSQYEEKLGVIFPPSYKEFVLKNGLIQFGKKNDTCRRMFFEYQPLTTELHAWQIDADKKYTKDIKEKIDKLITFSYGDAGLQICWFHCFDYNSLNPKTGEVFIYNFDQDETNTLLDDYSETMCEVKGFDCHMSEIVDEEIEFLLDTIESGF